MTAFSIFRSILIFGHPMILLFEVSTLKNNDGIEPVKNTEIVVVKVEISYLFPNTIMESSAKTKNPVTTMILQTIPLISDLIGKTLSETNQKHLGANCILGNIAVQLQFLHLFRNHFLNRLIFTLQFSIA